MSVRVVEKDCCLREGKLVIVLEGANPEEVLSNEARSMAIKSAAAFGYPRVGINGQSGSFPVDDDGKAYEDWNEQSKLGLISAYRNEIYLIGGI